MTAFTAARKTSKNGTTKSGGFPDNDSRLLIRTPKLADRIRRDSFEEILYDQIQKFLGLLTGEQACMGSQDEVHPVLECIDNQ